MKMACVRDAEGRIAHLGAWDFREVDVEVAPETTSVRHEWVDGTPDYPGEPPEYVAARGYHKRIEEVVPPVVERQATNPLPEGWTLSECEMREGPDGTPYPAEHYAQARRAAFRAELPIGDQLDALWKMAAVLDPATLPEETRAMLDRVRAVKEAVPKG